MDNKVYQIITDRLIEMIERDNIAPWRKPWQFDSLGNALLPVNHATGKQYRGVNLFMLHLGNMFDSHEWLTFKQAESLGGSVRKGEKGLPVIFWTQWKKDVDGKERTFPVLRYYTVFNLCQTTGIEYSLPVKPIDKPSRLVSPIDACERIVRGYHGKPEIQHGGDRACYSPSLDYIRMPQWSSFATDTDYYATLFHEMIHSTGHKSRLDREFGACFGNHAYSNEELIAEMGASFLCAMAGIEQSTIEQSAAYLQGWLSVIKKSPKMLIESASAAQKACDLIRNIKWEKKEETENLAA